VLKMSQLSCIVEVSKGGEQMPEITVRTRGDFASFSLPCGDTEHSFRADLEGNLFDSAHDPDEAAVMVALGGRPHGCGCAVQALHAARISYRAAIGLEDNPSARYRRRNGWATGEATCQSCSSYENSIEHVNGVEHQLSIQGLQEYISAAKTLLRWLHRRGKNATVLRTRQELRNAFPRSSRLPYVSARRWCLTPEFIELGLAIVGENYHQVDQLRRNGIKIQWLRTLVANLDSSAKTKIGNRNRFSSLAKARNVDAVTVAKFLNAGIYDHIHTYARAHVRPEQALAVFRATRGRKTLAEFLDEGMTAPQALASLGLS
jgi:hypothetical protein